MNQQDRLNLMLGMRTQTDFCKLFNDDYNYDDDEEPDKIYVCRVCEIWFSTKANLERHLKSGLHKRQVMANNDDWDDSKFYYCEPCDRFFISSPMASKHNKTTAHKKKLERKIKRDLKKSD
jgi:uncharacterized Zn-finger protein